MKTLDQLVVEIIEIEKQSNLEFGQKQLRLQSLWSEANDNIPPTVDANGRLHAPCSGYALPQNNDYTTTLQYGDDFLFEKGQFLPIPLADTNYTKSMNNVRYVKTKSIKDDVDEFLDRVKHNIHINTKFNSGKSWEYNNQEMCNIYVIVSDKSSEAIGELVIDYFNNIRESKIIKPVYTGVMTEGRRTVRGVVKNIGYSAYDTGFGYITTEKMTVNLDDNTTCYGSVPKGVHLSVGDTIEFTATFSKSDVAHHGWFKRPSKLEILRREV